jgi:hypothetical protein
MGVRESAGTAALEHNEPLPHPVQDQPQRAPLSRGASGTIPAGSDCLSASLLREAHPLGPKGTREASEIHSSPGPFRKKGPI